MCIRDSFASAVAEHTLTLCACSPAAVAAAGAPTRVVDERSATAPPPTSSPLSPPTTAAAPPSPLPPPSSAAATAAAAVGGLTVGSGVAVGGALYALQCHLDERFDRLERVITSFDARLARLEAQTGRSSG